MSNTSTTDQRILVFDEPSNWHLEIETGMENCMLSYLMILVFFKSLLSTINKLQISTPTFADMHIFNIFCEIWEVFLILQRTSLKENLQAALNRIERKVWSSHFTPPTSSLNTCTLNRLPNLLWFI